MNPRFDVFRKQNDHVIKWVGAAESLEDLDKLIRADSPNASQDDYVIVHSDYGLTEASTKVITERELRIAALSDRT
jgi:hypothetical protein